MPTIDQLAAAAQALSTADEIPISQSIAGQAVVSKTNLGAHIVLLGALGVLPRGIMVGQGAPTGSQGVDGWGVTSTPPTATCGNARRACGPRPAACSGRRARRERKARQTRWRRWPP